MSALYIPTSKGIRKMNADRRFDMIKRLMLDEDIFETPKTPGKKEKKPVQNTPAEPVESKDEKTEETEPKGILKHPKVKFNDDTPDSKRTYWEKQAKSKGIALSYLKDGKRKKKSIAEIRKELGQ